MTEDTGTTEHRLHHQDGRYRLELPTQYDHTTLGYTAPRRDRVLQDLREDKIASHHRVDLPDLSKILTAEIEDIGKHKMDFLGNAGTDVLLRIGRVIKARQYFEQNPLKNSFTIEDDKFTRATIETDYDDMHPFDRRIRELDELRQTAIALSDPEHADVSENKIHQLEDYVRFEKQQYNKREERLETTDPESLAREIFDDNFVIFQQFETVLHEHLQHRGREQAELHQGFYSHPFFVHLEFNEPEPSPKKAVVLDALKAKATEENRIDFSDAARLFEAELVDFGDEWNQLNQEVTNVTRYFRERPGINRCTLYRLLNGKRITGTPATMEGATPIFYNRTSMEEIYAELEDLQTETSDEGKPQSLRNALEMAAKLARGEKPDSPDEYAKLVDLLSTLDVQKNRFQETDPLYQQFQGLKIQALETLNASYHPVTPSE